MPRKKFHTMNPQADLLRDTGFDDLYQKLQQLDEAALLVEEGKLKREVYQALVENVKRSIMKQQTKTAKRDRGMWDGLLSGLRTDRDDDHGAESSPSAAAAAKEADSKPIIEGPLMKRNVTDALASRRQWKRRYCVLYERALVVYRHKGDAKPLTSIILTPEFFVTQVHDGAEEHDDEELRTGEDGDDESYVDESSQGTRKLKNGDMPHVFMLSDLSMRYMFACNDAEDLKYWIHIMTSVLRKIMDEEEYFDTPRLMDAPVRDPKQIAEDLEKRKEAYQRSQRQLTMARTKRRSFLGSRKAKPLSPEELAEEEERWESEGTALARDEVTEKLLAEERERVRRLEEDQRNREEELERVRKFAEQWKAQAESAQAKMEEAESRANKAEDGEKRLQEQLELMDQMREKNIEREDALRAQQEHTQNQLEAMESRKRQSQHPAAMEEYERQIKALEAKLAALQSALQVDLDDLDWDGTLEMAEEKLKECVPHMMSEDPREAAAAAEEFDQWDKIVRNHADYKKREEQKWIDWEANESAANAAAYRTMTQIVPPEVVTGCSEAFLESRGLRPAVAKRVMQTKIFHFLYMDIEAISKLHIADLSSRYIPQGLDIIELRAVYTRLPPDFQNDRDGRKKLWLEQYRQKLFSLTEKEKAHTLTRPEERHPVYRDSAPAVGGGASGNKVKKKKKGKKPNVAKKVDTKALEALFGGGGPPGPPRGLGGGGGGDDDGAPARPAGFPFGNGPPARVLEMRRRGEEQAAENGAGDGADDDASPVASSGGLSRLVPSRRRKSSSTAPAPAPLGRSGSLFTSVKSIIFGGDKSNGDATADAADNDHDEEEHEEDAFDEQDAEEDVEDDIVPEQLSHAQPVAPPPTKKPSKRQSMTEKQRLLAASVRGMMDEHKAKSSYSSDDFDESTAPAFDFGVNYGNKRAAARSTLSKQRAGEFSKGVERGIDKLCAFIKEEGAYDPAEGGLATITFGDLFEKYELSDMLVGLLMRGKKHKRLKYHGDMLFQGIHDQVKITLLVE
ncbi:Costars family protein ABRACL [Hondaea fermentalgiana]|uniref:Costars family protein ABRACL n=1 Tax=Hondaea fermentalgiana TaxID=2315210 RepID=A0A2R5GQY3_9STRA|nr:Costars family protein ABRACL [Hondaea fermentalgiana]|eukprot:GBG33005.1 Costars family protein ABRACL [Hondaea fermentalgiana]